MRARNIKPSLFKNEVLGTADPLLTILFEGLWCEADREGRLEDRPLRLKAEILPYRNDADIDAMLNWLTDHGFIARYEARSTKVIQVLKFSEHQRPHNNEVESVLPPMDVIKHNQGKKPAQLRKKALATKEESTSLLMLDADSGSLIPDSGSLDCSASKTSPIEPAWFAEFKILYPERGGDPNWHGAIRAGNARLKEGHHPGEFLDGARRYHEFCRITQKIGTEYVKQASTFLGPSKPFLQPWNLPATKAEVRLTGNLTAAQEFMRRTEPNH